MSILVCLFLPVTVGRGCAGLEKLLAALRAVVRMLFADLPLHLRASSFVLSSLLPSLSFFNLLFCPSVNLLIVM